jgi:hypothetical protein
MHIPERQINQAKKNFIHSFDDKNAANGLAPISLPPGIIVSFKSEDKCSRLLENLEGLELMLPIMR